ncbi:MAG: hypothetical protein QM278_06825 [Pseudomonadota bacterium]|nr:hypothetical protein [Pseudomonadota bacterium]
MKATIKYDVPDRLNESVTPLSPKQREVLVYLFEYFHDHNYYPTHREIVNHIGVAGTTAAAYVNPLIAKGYVEKTVAAGRGRNIRITELGLTYLRTMDAKRRQLELDI